MSKKSAANLIGTIPPAPPSKPLWIALALIAAITVFIYCPSLNAPFIFDDVAKIAQNPDIQHLSGLWRTLIHRYDHPLWESNDPSRPVTYLTFALNYHFGELRAWGYHVVNVLLHVLNIVLLFFLTKKLLFLTTRKESLFFSWAVAAMFALHPINTIDVSYIFNRSGELAAFFYLAATLLFIRAREGREFALSASIACFVLAIFSKQDAITLPAILLIIDFVFLNDVKGPLRKRSFYHLSFWIVLGGYIAFRYFYLGGLGDLEAGTQNPVAWPRFLYLGVEPYVLLDYLRLLGVPRGLCFDFDLVKPQTLWQAKFIASYITLAAFGVIAAIAYKRRTAGSKIALFSILWFFILLAPTSSIFPTTTTYAENRLYLPGYGFYLVMVLTCFTVFRVPIEESLCANRLRPRVWMLGFFLGGYLIWLTGLTMNRNRLYQDPIRIWEDVLAQYPGQSRALNNLASEHGNLALSYARSGNYAQAVREFQTSLALRPNDAVGHFMLGDIYFFDLKNYPKALEEYQTVVVLDPQHKQAHNALGTLYVMQKRYDKAFAEFKKAVEADPQSSNAHTNLGILLLFRNEPGPAVREFETALRLDPGNAAARKHLEGIRK